MHIVLYPMGWKQSSCFVALYAMMTSSNGNIFPVTGPLCVEFAGPGEFHTQRPVARSFDVFFDLRLNKRLSKQPWCWWFETPSWSLWRHCNGIMYVSISVLYVCNGLKPCFRYAPHIILMIIINNIQRINMWVMSSTVNHISCLLDKCVVGIERVKNNATTI